MPRRHCLSARTLSITFFAFLFVLALSSLSDAQRRRRMTSGASARAIVVDERLAALRDEPTLSAQLVQRLDRGRTVSITGTRLAPDGTTFHRVAVTSRTRGWIQAESLVSTTRAGDDERLLRLIRGSQGFDRIVRAQIFLDTFSRSPLRPAVLLIHGDAIEESTVTLSREATRRLNETEMTAGGASPHTYFMNYVGLDRYNRLGIRFIYDRAVRRFHYDGASWREIVRRYPNSPEATEARQRLAQLPTSSAR